MEPTLAAVLNELVIVEDKWQDIGIQLRLKDEALLKIDKHCTSLRSKLREMIRLWLESHKASWRNLRNALYSNLVNESCLARSVWAKYYVRSDRIDDNPRDSSTTRSHRTRYEHNQSSTFDRKRSSSKDSRHNEQCDTKSGSVRHHRSPWLLPPDQKQHERKSHEHKSHEHELHEHKSHEHKSHEHELHEHKSREHESHEHKSLEHESHEHKSHEHKSHEHELRDHKSRQHIPVSSKEHRRSNGNNVHEKRLVVDGQGNSSTTFVKMESESEKPQTFSPQASVPETAYDCIDETSSTCKPGISCDGSSAELFGHVTSTPGKHCRQDVADDDDPVPATPKIAKLTTELGGPTKKQPEGEKGEGTKSLMPCCPDFEVPLTLGDEYCAKKQFIARKCTKCRRLPYRPKRSKCCLLLYCEPCSLDTKYRHCSVCNREQTFRLDSELNNKIPKLTVYCKHSGIGCEWKGKLYQMRQHLLSQCAIPCPYSKIGCEQSVTNVSYKNHLQESAMEHLELFKKIRQ